MTRATSLKLVLDAAVGGTFQYSLLVPAGTMELSSSGDITLENLSGVTGASVTGPLASMYTPFFSSQVASFLPRAGGEIIFAPSTADFEVGTLVVTSTAAALGQVVYGLSIFEDANPIILIAQSIDGPVAPEPGTSGLAGLGLIAVAAYYASKRRTLKAMNAQAGKGQL